MSRTVLIVGPLDGHFERLRRVMLEFDCSTIRFTEPDRWRDSLNQDEIAAVVFSASISGAQLRRIQEEIRRLDSAAPFVAIGDAGTGQVDR